MVLPADSVWTSSQTISCIIIKYNKRYNAQGSNKWWTYVSQLWGEKKKHDFFLQTLQLKLPNVVTQILRNKYKLRFKLECRNTLNIIISGQFNICTNLPSIVNLKTRIPMFDTLAIEDMFFW